MIDQPAFDIGQSPRIERVEFVDHMECGGPYVVGWSEDFVDAILHPPLAILKGAVKHVTTAWDELAEHLSATGNGKCDRQYEPRFPDLRPAREHAEAFWQVLGNDPDQRLNLFPL